MGGEGQRAPSRCASPAHCAPVPHLHRARRRNAALEARRDRGPRGRPAARLDRRRPRRLVPRVGVRARRADPAGHHRSRRRADRRARRGARALGRRAHAGSGPPSSMTTGCPASTRKRRRVKTPESAVARARGPPGSGRRARPARRLEDAVALVGLVGVGQCGLLASTAASAGAAAATRCASVDAARSTMPGEVIGAADELGRARRPVDRVDAVLAADGLAAGARDVAGEEGVDVAGHEGDVVDRRRRRCGRPAPGARPP